MAARALLRGGAPSSSLAPLPRSVGASSARVVAARPMSASPSPKPNRSPASSASPSSEANHGSSSSSLSSYLSSLRLRAASALTSALPPDERSSLLRSLNAVDGSAVESAVEAGVTRSIGEAVAEAVREEARRSETRWRREREGIERRAEAAAAERVRHEMAVEQERRRGMERWRREVEAEEREEAEAGKEEEEEEDRHPILGRPLVDLGYKRVHIVPARSLAAVPIWEKQRVYRHDRARLMAADKAKTADLGLPGVVTLHEDPDGRLAILDGQHRVGMMAILQEKAKLGGGNSGGKDGSGDGSGDGGGGILDLDRVLVEVFPHRNPETRPKHAEDLFTEINKAEPVKLVDMPGIARGPDRKIIDGAAGTLASTYPDMFKPSQRCRVPHLNVDNLRDALFAADVLKRHSIKTDKALVDWMMEKNSELAGRYAAEGANGSKGATKAVSKSALAKAEKFNFFLGLDSSWLYQ